MKSMLFGLALLCALPGCCGMWKCDKEEKPKKEKKKCGDKCDKRNKGRKDTAKDMKK
jgi:hypothetical protein